MEAYYISDTYFYDRFINSISTYFNIPKSNIIRANFTVDNTNNVIKTRNILCLKYMEINNISEFHNVFNDEDVDCILNMIKSQDKETIKLGLDIFFSSKFSSSNKVFELLSFLHNVMHALNDKDHIDSCFSDKYNVYMYIHGRSKNPIKLWLQDQYTVIQLAEEMKYEKVI